jgi:hypothetical protein
VHHIALLHAFLFLFLFLFYLYAASKKAMQEDGFDAEAHTEQAVVSNFGVSDWVEAPVDLASTMHEI